MTGLDTNVLARYYVGGFDAGAATARQQQAARRLLEGGQPLRPPASEAFDDPVIIAT